MWWDAWSVAVAVVAAGATLWAVVVAMRTSRTALDEARRMRDEDRHARAKAERDKAVARAIVLDHEIYMLGGEIRELVEFLSGPMPRVDPAEALAFAFKAMPSDPLPMLTRFADDLEAFGTEGAASLLSALSSWYINRTLLDLSRFENLTLDEVATDLASVTRAFRTFLDVLREARMVTEHWATRGQGGLAETDF
ncbi:hypothetical protein D7Y61_18855 [Stenotrophomonas maltophilia]|nr:hypothetical protein [Stenotrophomonas maltophilia]